MGKIVKKIVILSFFISLVLTCIILMVSVYSLENEVYELKNSTGEMALHLDDISEMANATWDERVFEAEMRENIAYHLPNGFNSVVHYTGLTPLDFELGRARVTFIHRNKNYSVDFSYHIDGKGLQVEPISRVKEIE